ncbi:hypothetical protein BT67DRAFT_21546 [Trichocladium antarcticum]|uniref:Uncharacterized protein n=1 Tax=Trichocladium antarcticum TaxID=1450529 RepID=A0AAN6ZI61_9PEZI|nr:hypothetical protein BT67DRAFT_21546 [Trichocladium antarcticum]
MEIRAILAELGGLTLFMLSVAAIAILAGQTDNSPRRLRTLPASVSRIQAKLAVQVMRRSLGDQTDVVHRAGENTHAWEQLNSCFRQ